MLSVTPFYCYSEWHYVLCRYGECGGTQQHHLKDLCRSKNLAEFSNKCLPTKGWHYKAF